MDKIRVGDIWLVEISRFKNLIKITKLERLARDSKYKVIYYKKLGDVIVDYMLEESLFNSEKRFKLTGKAKHLAKILYG